MRRAFLWIFLMCVGTVACYDLTLLPDDHTVREFKVLAVHAEPPVLTPDVPMQVSVLFADPLGDAASVRAAWSVRLYDANADVQRVGETLAAGIGDAGIGIELPPQLFRLSDKSSLPALIFEVYLCHEGFVDPLRIGRTSESELLRTLCVAGRAASAVKIIDERRGEPHQGNPRIERVLLNGVSEPALDDGASAVQVCDEVHPCVQGLVSLEAYLDKQSIDIFTDEGIVSDAGDGSDGGVEKETYTERHRVDWFVTAGALAAPDSLIYSSDIDEVIGPYRNTWRLPDNAAQGEAMLYVVARDIRGGNDWRTFRVRWSGQ